MLSLILLGLVAASHLSLTEGNSCGRIVCYHTNWSQYRPSGGKFFPENIDPKLCTHMVYAFARLSGNHLQAFEWNDDSTEWSVGLFEKFANLKKINPSVKILLAVGGWNLGSAPFTHIVQSPSNRQEFISQSIKFLRDRNFDGLDLDWEYPANRGSPPEDRGYYTELVTEMKAAFVAESVSSGKSRLLLTAAVAAGKDKIDTAYDIPAVSRELDFINVMTYDLHGSWEKTTGHNSPLYARSGETGLTRTLNLDYAAKYWVQKGAPASKLNIGMALYGRSFTLASESNYQVGAPALRAGDKGQYTREAGFISYYEVCDMMKSGGQVEFIEEQRVPFIHKGHQWVGYDNPDSLREKVRFVKQNNFGGVMVWALPLDDFSGNHCGEGPFPLMHAINDECKHNSGSLHTPAPSHTTSRPYVTVAPDHTSAPTTHVTHTLVPNEEFVCPAKDGFYPSPTSCVEYYICASHVSYVVRCGTGMVFNPNTGFCDFPQNYHCTKGDAPVEPQTTTMRPHVETTHAYAGDINNFCQHQESGIYPDPTDCARFIDCSNGNTYIEVCAPATAWNDVIKSCDRLENIPGCDHTA